VQPFPASVDLERATLASFVHPLRGPGRGRRWLIGVVLVALLPIAFIPVFGYAVTCARTAAHSLWEPPPPWRLNARLLTDGAWSSLQAALLTLPFAFGGWWLGSVLAGHWHPTGDPFVSAGYAWTVALTLAALAAGLVLLVVVPPTLARFAVSGRPTDLAALGSVVECVRGRFAAWNLALAVITTSWIVAAAGLGLLVIGVIPGVFYAILTSAHACAALSPDRAPR
jgi:hypothetical protein